MDKKALEALKAAAAKLLNQRYKGKAAPDAIVNQTQAILTERVTVVLRRDCEELADVLNQNAFEFTLDTIMQLAVELLQHSITNTLLQLPDDVTDEDVDQIVADILAFVHTGTDMKYRGRKLMKKLRAEVLKAQMAGEVG